jgi:hypothetical protein
MTSFNASVKTRKQNSLCLLSFCGFWFREMLGKEKFKIQVHGTNLPVSHTQIFDYITSRKSLLLRNSVRNYTVKKFLRILLTPRCYYRIQKPWHSSLSSERWIQSVFSCTHSLKFTIMLSPNEIRSLAKWLYRFTHQNPRCLCNFPHKCQIPCPFHPP